MNAHRPKRTEELRISPRRAAAEARVGGHKYALAAYRAALADYLYAGSVPIADAQSKRAGEASNDGKGQLCGCIQAVLHRAMNRVFKANLEQMLGK